MEMTFRLDNGLEHGLINTVGNSVPDDGFKRFAEKDREEMKKKKKEDERMVQAQYLNKDGANERLERPYANWAGQPITMWRFIHGHTYTVPKGLIDDVNSPHKRTKKRSGLMDKAGKPLDMDEWAEPHHRFVPVGF
jgi:hypothetical protein